ncbi:MAG: TetR family transcriptional regulator [Polyangiaceae bacterium]
MTERASPGRAEILAAAARAFAEHGYHGMSMRDLAKLTKRSPATLYNYVDCKEDLLYLIQRDAFEEMLERCKGALEGVRDPEARLHAFVTCHVDFFADRQYLMRVLIHEAAALPTERRAEIRGLKEAYFAIAKQIVSEVAKKREGAEPPALDVERNTYCLFGMLNWTYGWYEPARHGKPDELAATIEHVALRGITAPAHGPKPAPHRTEKSRGHLDARSGGAR